MSYRSIKEKFKNSVPVRLLKNKYFLVTVAFILLITFIDSNNVIRWVSDLRELSEQKRQIEYYKEAIQKSDEQLKELRSNKDSLEKFAREQYFFHAPDEELFIIEEEK